MSAVPVCEIKERTLVISGDEEPLTSYLARADHAWLMESLRTRGSLLFRGFGPLEATAFRAAIGSLIGEFLEHNGEHMAIAGQSSVFRPVPYAPECKLLWHNENSFNASWPQIIAFGCLQPARTGGATVLVSSQEMMHALDSDLVEEFRVKQVRYVRRLGLGVGRHWQEIFNTPCKATAEAACRASGLGYRWLDNEVLETHCVRAAVIPHRDTGVDCWFNQAQHWHSHCLDAQSRRDLCKLLGEERMPRECRFGDDSAIPDSTMDHILQTYAALEWPIQWQPHDVLIVDNEATAHGRDPYSGTRELLVSMGMARPELR